MPDKAYWSIDLDFWGTQHFWGINRGSDSRKVPVRKLDALLKLDVPIFACKYHHEMLVDLEDKAEWDWTTLINIDYHSDLPNQDDIDRTFKSGPGHFRPDGYWLDEGNWIGFTPHIEHRKFKWIYPYSNCNTKHHGWCHDPEAGDPFKSDTSGFFSVELELQQHPQLDASGVVAIGLCVSPNWSTGRNCMIFADWLETNRQYITMSPKLEKWL
jgi:hypothetical protein